MELPDLKKDDGGGVASSMLPPSSPYRMLDSKVPSSDGEWSKLPVVGSFTETYCRLQGSGFTLIAITLSFAGRENGVNFGLLILTGLPVKVVLTDELVQVVSCENVANIVAKLMKRLKAGIFVTFVKLKIKI